MALTPKIGITELTDQQAGAETTYNQGMRLMETMASRTVKDRDISAPPGSPADGDAYIVKATGTGDWAGHDNKIAVYATDAWKFITPQEGNSVYLQDENVDVVWNGSVWLAYGGSQALTTSGSTIDWDASKGLLATADMPMAGAPASKTVNAPTNLQVGWIYVMRVTQPSAPEEGGSYQRVTLTWNAIFNWSGGSQATTIAADAVDMFVWIYDGTKLQEINAVLNLS